MSDSNPRIKIPFVPHEKVTSAVLQKVEAMILSSLGEVALETEPKIEEQFGIPKPTQRRYKAQVRKVLNMLARVPLKNIDTAKLREALIYIITRKERNDRGVLRKVKRFVVLVNEHGVYSTAEEYLLSMFTREGNTMTDAYTALRNQCVCGKVFKEDVSGKLELCKLSELPSIYTIQVWLRKKSKENLSIQWAKMNKAERDSFSIYVKRDPKQWRVRGYQEGDHTELDVQVVNSQTGKYGRLWASIWVDRRSSLGCGYYLSYHPDSTTIALSMRNSFFGTQLKVATPGGEDGAVKYQSLENFEDICEDVEIDNGKDYKSRYTGQVFGKIDFSDDVRRTIQRFTAIHYAERLHPQSKPYVENRFRWLNEYWKKLPGYKGPHYKRKPSSLRDEEKQNVIMFDWQFAQLFDLAWHAHNNRPMKRLNGMSRIQYALTHQHNRRMVKDERIFDLLMLSTPKQREIRRGYVAINGIDYFSADLERYNKQYCTAYYDPQNVGYAHIWIGGKFITIAVKTDLIGKTQREWIEIVKMRKANEKNLNAEIAEMHKNISNIEAKAHAWNGMVGNVSFVSGELIDQRSVAVNILTGIEQQAAEVAEKKKRTDELVEIERAAKKHAKKHPLTLSMVNNIK